MGWVPPIGYLICTMRDYPKGDFIKADDELALRLRGSLMSGWRVVSCASAALGSQVSEGGRVDLGKQPPIA